MNQITGKSHAVNVLKPNFDPFVPCSSQKVVFLKKPTIVMRDGRYTLYDNGIVCDCYSALEWFCGPDEDTSWVDARDWVERLTLGGGGWSLPSISELRGLYKKNKAADLLTPLFKREPGDVWSNDFVNDAEALGFNFVPGNQFRTYKAVSRRFRAMAVRSRQQYREVGELQALRTSTVVSNQ